MHKKIASILRKLGNSECLEKAKKFENSGYQTSRVNLRNLGLLPNDIIAIATILEKDNDSIKSISFSYNNRIGDIGATALARSLPSSIDEIGLVDCGIGDIGGNEILHWIKKTPNLKMICIEQNKFSDLLKMEFKVFKNNNPKIMVVI
jgi:hypothetical protein